MHQPVDAVSTNLTNFALIRIADRMRAKGTPDHTVKDALATHRVRLDQMDQEVLAQKVILELHPSEVHCSLHGLH